MKLQTILENVDYQLIKGNIHKEINKIAYDSRKVEKGDIFICIRGSKVDGHLYAKEAVEKGALTIICEEDLNIDNSNITILKVENSRQALAIVASNYYDNPSKKLKIIGITGTNGKTTTAFIIKGILERAGYKVGLIGTIANYMDNEVIEATNTTPESLELQQLFFYMVEKGIEYCVMEVSSHSLALDRVYGVEFTIGIFTNLTRDHLDFHKTFENYYRAKLKLFQRSCISIINIDDTYGIRIINDIGERKVKTYSIKNPSNFQGFNIKVASKSSSFRVNLDKEEEFDISLPGEYNIYNALGGILAAISLGVQVNFIKEALKNVVVSGRCERIATEYNLPYDIVIDYAHTPDGLENILTSAREFTKGKLIAVFGCGGDRDVKKRPEMGKIGTELSDIAIITSDNPRSEKPFTIISDILRGVKKCNYMVIEERKEAIKRALELAKEGDVIVIAGKGHETYQITNKGKIHFDEREIVKEILNNMR